ncbi:MAG: DNRLRE domain-containing protein [Anaerolineae bacterium]|jgi:hypothetical protein
MQTRRVLVLVGVAAIILTATPVIASGLTRATRSECRLSSQIIVLDSTADATLRSWMPGTNFGGEDVLEVSHEWIDASTAREAATLVRFNLSSLPSDAVIDNASLRLYLEDARGDSPVGIGAYYVTSAWDESTVTWSASPETEAVGVTASIDASVGSYKTWDITSFAQSWVGDESSNHGVLLRGPRDDANYERLFQGREHLDLVPFLEITYHLPHFTFSGHVYEGAAWDTGTPAEGVQVQLWGDEDEWPEAGFDRVLLASDVSAAGDGAFRLEWTRDTEWPYIHVIEADPPGTISTGADVIAPGYVKNLNVVSYQYSDLLATGWDTFTGIAFWDRLDPSQLEYHIYLPALSRGN